MALNKVLIANRGEIAVRIIRSLRELGLQTAAVYSEADVDCRHVQLADEAHCIGPPPAAKSYLDKEKLVALAGEIGADAVHPGYGFLSESTEFASLCEENGLIFIGPTPENMRLAGDKLTARTTVAEAGLPVIPGCNDPILDMACAQSVCAELGYPIMLKASAGGGGRGMRILNGEDDLTEDFAMAAAEARAAFGNPTLYAEKLILRPRHIEVQILGDGRGRAIHLMERNCSAQRRHQKLIEEAPSPSLKPDVRTALHQAAVRIAEAIRYRNAGTIEFLLDENDRFYFMELNARIQVEHPVTEMITGCDLIKAQIDVASGRGLNFQQDDIQPRGHAIECRLNAEDPAFNFMPSPGLVESFREPGGFGVRFDSHLYQGYNVPIYYDSLLGKLICWGPTRPEAVKTMERALTELVIEPIETTRLFLLKVLETDAFVRGDYCLDLIEQLMPSSEDEEAD